MKIPFLKTLGIPSLSSYSIKPLRDWYWLCFGALLVVIAFASLGIEGYRGMAESLAVPTSGAPALNIAMLANVAKESAGKASQIQLLQSQGSGVPDPSR